MGRMNNQQYFQTASLSYRLKVAGRELEAFRSGEAYVKLRAEYEGVIRSRNATIKKLQKERNSFSLSRKKATRQWMDVLEDVQKEYEKEIKRLKKTITELLDIIVSLKNRNAELDSIENEKNLTWNKQMPALIQEMIHENNKAAEEIADEKIAEFEARYDAVVQTVAKEYEDMPPSDYYRDGYNLFLRMVKYKHNHLLFLSNPVVEPDNNLCERKARVLKGKINQAISLRSFEHLEYFCECPSVPDHFATDSENNLYKSVQEVFRREKPAKIKVEIPGNDTVLDAQAAG